MSNRGSLSKSPSSCQRRRKPSALRKPNHKKGSEKLGSLENRSRCSKSLSRNGRRWISDSDIWTALHGDRTASLQLRRAVASRRTGHLPRQGSHHSRWNGLTGHPMLMGSTQNFVALGIGQDHPGVLTLPDVDGDGPEVCEARHLGGLIRPPYGQIEMDPVLAGLRFRYLNEHQDNAEGVIRTRFGHPQIGLLTLDLPAQDFAPESGHSRRVETVDDRLTNNESHG